MAALSEPEAPPIEDDEGAPVADDGAGSAHDETWRACTQPGCGNSFAWRAGMGRRSKCDLHYQGTGKRAGKPPKADGGEPREWSLEDAISTPLSRSEKELAQRIEILVRLVGGGVYRLNMIDGMIVSHHADKLAEGLVIEARTSSHVKKIVDSMATFSGSGPLVLVLVQMSMEIAANHKVPVIGDLTQVPAPVLADAARVTALREARRERQEQVAKPSPVPRMVFAECPQCQRRAIGQPGAEISCAFDGARILLPVG